MNRRTMINVDTIDKTYGSVRALNNVTFHIEQGETVGLLGPNGAGKTTLMRILSTYRQPSSGTVFIHDLDTATNERAVRRHVGYLPESVPLYDDMTPIQYLRYRGRLKGLDGTHRIDRVQEVLDDCNLTSVSDRLISDLSKGYRKRLGLADALVAEPDVLLLDEPTEGLDPNQVRETRELIQSLSQETTLLLATHILADVRAVCDRILIISGGQLRYDGPVDPTPRSQEQYTIRLVVTEASEQLTSAITLLNGVESVREPEDEDAHTLLITASTDVRTRLYQTCSDLGVPIQELTWHGNVLQKRFARFTEGEEQ